MLDWCKKNLKSAKQMNRFRNATKFWECHFSDWFLLVKTSFTRTNRMRNEFYKDGSWISEFVHWNKKWIEHSIWKFIWMTAAKVLSNQFFEIFTLNLLALPIWANLYSNGPQILYFQNFIWYSYLSARMIATKVG